MPRGIGVSAVEIDHEEALVSSSGRVGATVIGEAKSDPAIQIE